jgi:hypothetical protein
MILTSRILNFLTFGSFDETFCSRIFRHRRSVVAGLLIPLIDAGFYHISGEEYHVYQCFRSHEDNQKL